MPMGATGVSTGGKTELRELHWQNVWQRRCRTPRPARWQVARCKPLLSFCASIQKPESRHLGISAMIALVADVVTLYSAVCVCVCACAWV